MQQTILLPTIFLVLWSLVMLLWVAVTRFPAIAKHKKEMKTFPFGGRGEDLAKVLPAKVTWKAQNYDHLMEQPTIFYATVFVLVAIEQGSGLNTAFAWAYCLLRIAHSIWQATVNKIIPVRIGLFAVSSIILIILALRAAWSTFFLMF